MSGWVARLSAGALTERITTDVDMSAWLAQQDGPMCSIMADAAARHVRELPGSRHDGMTRGQTNLVSLGVKGHRGAGEALEALRQGFTTELANEPRRDVAGEWNRALVGAVRQSGAWTSGVLQGPRCGHDEPREPVSTVTARRLVLTPASAIRTRRVTWLWDARLALGIFALLAGREGLGKSSFAYWLAACITRGQFCGEHHGQPRAVLVSATEDSWEHTIVPRLIAAGADLTRVFRVEVATVDATIGELILPRDNAEVEDAARRVGAALLLLAR